MPLSRRRSASKATAQPRARSKKSSEQPPSSATPGWYPIAEVLAQDRSCPPGYLLQLAEALLSQQSAYAVGRPVEEDGTIGERHEPIWPDTFHDCHFCASPDEGPHPGTLLERSSGLPVYIDVRLSVLNVPQTFSRFDGRPAPPPPVWFGRAAKQPEPVPVPAPPKPVPPETAGQPKATGDSADRVGRQAKFASYEQVKAALENHEDDEDKTLQQVLGDVLGKPVRRFDIQNARKALWGYRGRGRPRLGAGGRRAAPRPPT